MEKTILVTGGAGYLGSHLSKALKNNGYRVVCYDQRYPSHTYTDINYRGDIRDNVRLNEVFMTENIDLVCHLAGRIEVEMSELNPELFWDTNHNGTINLLEIMSQHNVDKLIFSSTAGVYAPYLSVYAQTKVACEQSIEESGIKHVIFRYFNLAGADSDCEMGEEHIPETHLIPKVLQNLNNIKIFGDDYNTEDGTCIRDYVHVEDVCDAHLKAINFLYDGSYSTQISLGSGVGYSVKQIIDSIQKVVPNKLEYIIEHRRKGDPDRLVADINAARNILNWTPTKDIMDIVVSAYNWEQKRKAKC